MSDTISFTSPVGRLVSGDIFKGRNTDKDGRPLLFKSGPNAGQPKTEYPLGLAIHKSDPGWPAFEATLKQAAQRDFPALFPNGGPCTVPTFAWKFHDGDSTVPNSAGTIPNQNPGWAGCHVVFFSTMFAPSVFKRNDRGQFEQLTDPDSVKRGYYVRVAGNVKGNGEHSKPGIYINYNMVELVGYGEVLQSGANADQAFSSAASYSPPGMTAAPVTTAPPPVAPVAAPPAPVAAPPAPVAAVPPNPAFTQPPAPPAPVAAPPAAPETLVMTPKANGQPYQTFRNAGWTDEALIAEGYAEMSADLPF